MSPRIETTAMILAAGLGTRLKALTQDRPKALVELNGKPLLQHCIENLIANGFYHIAINVHHFGEQIIDFVDHFTMKPEEIRKTVEHLTWKIQMQRVLDAVYKE
jgi:NDP-sugar pyrophosphorylase family protein